MFFIVVCITLLLFGLYLFIASVIFSEWLFWLKNVLNPSQNSVQIETNRDIESVLDTQTIEVNADTETVESETTEAETIEPTATETTTPVETEVVDVEAQNVETVETIEPEVTESETTEPVGNLKGN